MDWGIESRKEVFRNIILLFIFLRRISDDEFEFRFIR